MKLNLKIKQLNPDRSNYKRNGIVYEPDDLVLQVDVPESMVVPTDARILTENGLKWVVGTLANLSDGVVDAHIQKIKKGG